MFVTVLKRRNIPSLFVSGCVTLNLTTSITQKLPFDGKTGLVTITNSAPADSSPYILLELSLKHSVQEHSMFLTVFSLSKSFHGKSSLNELAWSAFSVAIDIISLELFPISGIAIFLFDSIPSFALQMDENSTSCSIYSSQSQSQSIT